MRRSFIGDQATDLDFVVPVDSAISTPIKWVDADKNPANQESRTWRVDFIDEDTAEALMTVTPVVTANVMTISETAETVAESLGRRTRIRWRLRDAGADRDVLAGRVHRDNVGWGRDGRLGSRSGVTVQVTDHTLTIQSSAGIVVSSGRTIDAGGPESVWDEFGGLDAGDLDAGAPAW